MPTNTLVWGIFTLYFFFLGPPFFFSWILLWSKTTYKRSYK